MLEAEWREFLLLAIGMLLWGIGTLFGLYYIVFPLMADADWGLFYSVHNLIEKLSKKAASKKREKGGMITAKEAKTTTVIGHACDGKKQYKVRKDTVTVTTTDMTITADDGNASIEEGGGRPLYKVRKDTVTVSASDLTVTVDDDGDPSKEEGSKKTQYKVSEDTFTVSASDTTVTVDDGDKEPKAEGGGMLAVPQSWCLEDGPGNKEGMKASESTTPQTLPASERFTTRIIGKQELTIRRKPGKRSKKRRNKRE